MTPARLLPRAPLPSPRFVACCESYEVRFGREPTYTAVASYDAVTVLADALSRAAPGESPRDVYFAIVRNCRFEPL